MTGRPSFKSKERSSAVLTGQTCTISFTAGTNDAKSGERNKVLTSLTGYVVAKCYHYMYNTVVLAESIAVRIEKFFSTK